MEPIGPSAFSTDAARWEALLCMLEAVRQVADLQELQRAMGAPAWVDDPRVRWLQAQCKQLEDPEQLSRWDGVVRYEK